MPVKINDTSLFQLLYLVFFIPYALDTITTDRAVKTRGFKKSLVSCIGEQALDPFVLEGGS